MRDASRLAVIVLLGLGSLASCRSGEGKLDLTLRTRQGVSSEPPPGCTFYLDSPHAETTTKCLVHKPELHWVAADGRVATRPARTADVYFSSSLDRGAVDCDGHRPPGNFTWFKWSSPPDSPVDFDRLTIDDGNELVLYGERGLAIYDGIEISCSESSGRWRGVAGTMVGRGGTYTSVYDTVQIVLHLVEE